MYLTSKSQILLSITFLILGFKTYLIKYFYERVNGLDCLSDTIADFKHNYISNDCYFKVASITSTNNIKNLEIFPKSTVNWIFENIDGSKICLNLTLFLIHCAFINIGLYIFFKRITLHRQKLIRELEIPTPLSNQILEIDSPIGRLDYLAYLFRSPIKKVKIYYFFSTIAIFFNFLIVFYLNDFLFLKLNELHKIDFSTINSLKVHCNKLNGYRPESVNEESLINYFKCSRLEFLDNNFNYLIILIFLFCQMIFIAFFIITSIFLFSFKFYRRESISRISPIISIRLKNFILRQRNRDICETVQILIQVDSPILNEVLKDCTEDTTA